MIRVTFTENRVTLQGHANYAPKGEDVVCAAVSALVYALIGTLEEMNNVRELVIRPGYATVAAHEKTTAFDMVQRGLAQIASKYPQCVELR